MDQGEPGTDQERPLKDWAPGRGYRVLFGEGVSPWTDIFAAAESVGGVEHYLIEQEEGPAAEQMQRAEKCLANWKKMRALAPYPKSKIKQEHGRTGAKLNQRPKNLPPCSRAPVRLIV